MGAMQIDTSSADSERYALDQLHAGSTDAARAGEHEISGHGRSATRTQDRHGTLPAPSTAATVAPRPGRAVGPRAELARYQVPSGPRIVHGQRVDGIVRVTDHPAGGRGRAYLVERKLETTAELEALIVDYLDSAERLQAVPMRLSPIN